MTRKAAPLLRSLKEPRSATFLELLIDVVFVLALAMLSRLLLADLSWVGAAQTLILLLALSAVWAVASGICNKFDPRRRPIQMLILGALLGTLVMAAAAPEAFGDRGLDFAGAYVATQLGSVGILTLLQRDHEIRRTLMRIAFWLGVSAVPWISGALVQGSLRGMLWVLAVAVEYFTALLLFPTPGLGRASVTKFAFSGEHLADRYRQFFIIALGELILVTGQTFDRSGFHAPQFAAVLTAFATTVLLWRIYIFSAGTLMAEAIAAASGPVRARPVVYVHSIMVAGIIPISVGYELVIAHPFGHTPPAWIAVILGGPALFLTGRALFEFVVFNRLSWSRPIGVLVLAIVSPAVILVPPLGGAAIASLVLAGVSIADEIRGRRDPPELRPPVG
ncbi:low temperature requirement protein A [Micromonospora sp. NPDC007208]|uniref:low temperature requirement protein A n=1 Tax=Micromonospora sp. NPDC007208 TaxID=3364236 RepID=UPI0036BDFFAE